MKARIISRIILASCCFLAVHQPVSAQIIPDETLGAERSRITPHNPSTERIEGGARRGANLFHSFQEFNVNQGRGAYFANPADIENILTRVTGGNPSEILGTLGVLGNANLFFLNPNGIIFGPNARLDIQGSFLASTANHFTFPDGSEFSATNPQAPPLLTVSVPIGLQYGINRPGKITNQGNLSVGQDLTLAANNLELQGELQAGRDLTLQAQDTVQVRDGGVAPFLARSQGNLTIHGDREIDILTLNSPQPAFQSGGNLSLIGDGRILTDAHFTSGGNFAIRTRSGRLGNFASRYDPVFTVGGNYSIGDYTGVSLQVNAGGDINYGTVEINGIDPSVHPTNPALFLTAGGTITGTGSVSTTVPGGGLLVNFQSRGDINIQGITTQGGSIILNSTAGGITTNGNTLDTTNSVNDGGVINLAAANGNITIGNLATYSSSFSLSGSSSSGNGGAINLTAANGNITTGNLATYSSSYSSSGSSSSGNGGAITLSVPNGSITTGGLGSGTYSFSYSGFFSSSGNGGAITLSAPNGNITAGGLGSGTYSSSEFFSSSSSSASGDGGAIRLTSGGSITTGGIGSGTYSSSGSSSASGNGGAIILTTSNGSITINDSYSNSTARSYSGSSSSEDGGAISLAASNGSVTTGNLESYSGSFSGSSSSSSSSGDGGAISLAAANSITTRNLKSSSSSSFSSGNGGAISLAASNGSITTNILLSLSSSKANTTARGGNINLSASEDITTASINTTSQSGSGDITITTNGKVLFRQAVYKPSPLDDLILIRPDGAAVITSDTFGNGAGGDIWITAQSIFLVNGSQISASTHSSGAGGTITLRASDRIELSGISPDNRTPGELLIPLGGFVFDQGGVAGTPKGIFLGGYIPTGNIQNLALSTNIVYPSGVFTQTTTGSTGNAGNLFIETGRLVVRDGATIAATTFGQGRAGNISINTPNGSVSVNNGSILSGVAGGSTGSSGAIDIQTRSLSVTGGGLVQTQTLGQGDAGAIRVTAADSVNLSGAGSGLRSGSGGSNPLLGTIGSNIGKGGDISVTTTSLFVADRAALDAQTTSNSKGGNITVNANTLSAVKGGQLLTSTSGAGQAGDITVSAKEIQLSGANSGLFAQTSSAAPAGNLRLQPLGKGQTLRVNFIDGAQVSASTSGGGRGGNLTITAPESISLSGNGSIISAETSGSGTGGDLTLKTGTLTVQDEAKVTVSSTGTGDAGNLKVTANTVLLDNGELIAQTASGEGGNIYLKVEDLLLMRNNSLISAQAGNNGNGGNIDIDARLIVAVPKEDSDIVADADRGNGGNINITTSGIFGLEYRNQRTPESDITASSKFGVSGTVTINSPDVDPSRGLAALPTNVIDPSQQIAQSCASRGERANRFVATGRGGLPLSPDEPLRGRAVVTPGWVTLDWEAQTSANSRQVRGDGKMDTTSSSPTEIVEADGWVVDAKGNVTLVAHSQTTDSVRSNTLHSLCHHP